MDIHCTYFVKWYSCAYSRIRTIYCDSLLEAVYERATLLENGAYGIVIMHVENPFQPRRVESHEEQWLYRFDPEF